VEPAQKIIEGGRQICTEAGIPLAGGHSIDSPEPIFGLAVTGIVPIQNLKKNNTASEGDYIFLSKALGVGILSTAQKRGLLQPEHLPVMISQMSTLNKLGEELGTLKGVSAMTDVTGFGFLGHLIEMAEGSGLSAEISYDKIPVAAGVREYIGQRIFPDATTRNWSSYSSKVKFEKGVNVMEAFTLLPDPQTNGGLLVSARPEMLEELIPLLGNPVGRMVAQQEKIVLVMP
jgi:selenide,water dikinase